MGLRVGCRVWGIEGFGHKRVSNIIKVYRV